MSTSCIEFQFGSFKLPAGAGLLLHNDEPVRIGSRALDLLLALVERAGRVVSKQELVSRAWPAGGAQEPCLRFHIASLRRLLGEGHEGERYISNVNGRGYAFVADVQRAELPRSAWAAPPKLRDVPHNLPAALTSMLGRDALLERLARALPARRCIAITGAAGMGKSTLALALARHLAGDFPDGVGYVDASTLREESQLPSAIAAALGFKPAPVPLAELLRHRRLLLVLDNIEQLSPAIRELPATLPGLHLILTSRRCQDLGAGETIRLEPLPLPAAVQLFVERAAASAAGFRLSAENAEAVLHLCQALDGMPFAIELLAAHADAFGVQDMLDQLPHGLLLHLQGRRGDPERHRSLKALLDWTCQRLDPRQQQLLERAAHFSGRFTHDELTGSAEPSADLQTLVAESLIECDASGTLAVYRLLRTTRQYANARALARTDAAAPHSQLFTRP